MQKAELSLKQVYVKGHGPYYVQDGWVLSSRLGFREKEILASEDCAHFSHAGNRDTDFYLSDTCITYYSPTKGSFTIDTKTQTIVG